MITDARKKDSSFQPKTDEEEERNQTENNESLLVDGNFTFAESGRDRSDVRLRWKGRQLIVALWKLLAFCTACLL